MKVLWITNILLPAIQRHLNIYSNAGGWMSSLAYILSHDNNIELYVASVTRKVTDLYMYSEDNICYYSIPYGKGNLHENKEYEKYWKEINSKVKPDIVHIHGTEFTHGLSYIKMFGPSRVIVSIQGLLSQIHHYSLGGLSRKEIIKHKTLRDFVFHTDLNHEKKEFKLRSKYEQLILQQTRHIIGRTYWDRVHSLAINPTATYYHVNETLRNCFYNGTWNYTNCSKHTIFLSQASAALKGAHWVIKALPLILKDFPNTTIRIAGKNILQKKSLRDWLKQTNYTYYLQSLIKNYKLEDRIVFLGNLSDEEMKKEYMSANVFICSSAIENSPNSLCEAQILGVPCIASYVGGIPDFMSGNNSIWLYRYDDIEILADKVTAMFKLREKASAYSAQEIAKKRHDATVNSQKLISIYKKIINND